MLDDAYKEIQELVGSEKKEEKVKKQLRGIISKANVHIGKKVVENIIATVPDAYDKKRRKVERKKEGKPLELKDADKTWEEEKKELKERIENYEERKRKQAENVEKRKQKQIEKLAQGGSSSSSSSNVFGMRGLEARPLPMPSATATEIEQKAPSLMNLTNLTEILQHSFNNNKLSSENMSKFKKAKTEFMSNRSNKAIKNQTIATYREIYKEDIYKK